MTSAMPGRCDGCGTDPHDGLTFEAAYRLHGFVLVVRSNVEDLFEPLDAYLGYYREQAAPESDGNQVTIDVVVEAFADWDAGAQALRDDQECRFLGELSDGAGAFSYFQIGERQLVVRDPDILAVVPGRGHADAEIHVTWERSCQYSGHTFRKKASGDHIDWETVIDLVKGLAINGRSLALIHGAVLATEQGGILIAGDSGCGKTTTSAALARAGAVLLTDDLCVLNASAGELSMGGVMMPLRFVGRAPTSLARVEESLQQEGRGPKRLLRLGDAVLAHRWSWVTPRTVFLLEGQPGRKAEHEVQPLSQNEACVRMLGLFVDPLTWFRRKQHLETAVRLTEACGVYRLRPGSDLQSLPGTLLSYL